MNLLARELCPGVGGHPSWREGQSTQPGFEDIVDLCLVLPFERIRPRIATVDVDNTKDPMEVIVAGRNLAHIHQIHLHAVDDTRFRDGIPLLVPRVVRKDVMGRVHGQQRLEFLVGHIDTRTTLLLAKSWTNKEHHSSNNSPFFCFEATGTAPQQRGKSETEPLQSKPVHAHHSTPEQHVTTNLQITGLDHATIHKKGWIYCVSKIVGIQAAYEHFFEPF